MATGARPTQKQLFVLRALDGRGPKTAGYLGARLDTLKRMQERGWVSSPGYKVSRWTITEAGKSVLAEFSEDIAIEFRGMGLQVAPPVADLDTDGEG